MKRNLNFKMLSLNARGIRAFEKRKVLFHWLAKDKSDIIFLQETYSTPKVENIWKSQWRRDIYFSHGLEHSRGVMILVKEGFVCEFKVCCKDTQGSFIILKGVIHGQELVLANIYAPNRANDQCIFFEEIQTHLDDLEIETNCEMFIGGDFNVILDTSMDGVGGKPKLKESCKMIENLCSSFGLIDIWRIRNPEVQRFTWRQKKPIIQRRLDFWLITSSIEEDIENVDISPAIRTDHSAITMDINGIEQKVRGPSFWKFNSILVEDDEYIALIFEKYKKWQEEGSVFQDPRVLWDLLNIKFDTKLYSLRLVKRRPEKEGKNCQL